MKRWFARPALLALTLAGSALRAGVAADLPQMDCVIEPSQVIDVSSAVRGVVQTVLVERGDVVQEGQIVARLESGVEQAALEYARARAASNSQIRSEELAAGLADRHKERLASLYTQKILSQEQMDESVTGAQLKSLQLQQARENQRLAELDARQADEVLKRHIIRSPIQGVVVQRFLGPGESVVEKPILRLAQISPLRVEIIVPVAYFGAVQPGQRAVVVPEAPKNGQYTGVVTGVDRVADAASGTFRARVSLPNPNFELPSGLRCSVKLLQPGEAVAQKELPAPPTARPRTGGSALSTLTSDTAAPPASRGRSEPMGNPAGPPGPTEQPAARLCQVLGPIATQSQAQELRASLIGAGGRVALRAEAETRAQRYAVLTSRTGSAETAQSLVEKLRDAGFAGAMLVSHGRHAGSVSVGVYAAARPASQRRDAVNAAGFDFEVVPVVEAAQKYWLDAEAPHKAEAITRYRQAIDAAAPTARADPVPCPVATVAQN